MKLDYYCDLIFLYYLLSVLRVLVFVVGVKKFFFLLFYRFYFTLFFS